MMRRLTEHVLFLTSIVVGYGFGVVLGAWLS